MVQNKSRPDSLVTSFSFSPQLTGLAHEVIGLLKGCLGVDARLVMGDTTLTVSTVKASAGLLFKFLCGSSAWEKHVPDAIFQASRQVTSAFLDAYVTGAGHCSPNGKISVTSLSRSLAYSIAWLALKLGYLPAVDDGGIP